MGTRRGGQRQRGNGDGDGNGVLRTIHRSQRLVSLAVRSVTLAGAMSGGAGRVWIFLEGWLGGLAPTMFTCCMRNLVGMRHSVVSVNVREAERRRSVPVAGVGVETRNL